MPINITCHIYKQLSWQCELNNYEKQFASSIYSNICARAPQSRDHYCSRLCQLSCSDNESIIINNLHDIWYELAQLGGELSLYTLTAHNSTHFQINQIIIPTVETTRQKYLLQKFIENNCFSLFVGPTGTGKSAITNDYVLSLPSAE